MFDNFCRLALKNYIRKCHRYTGSPLWNSGYEGSKIDLLSKIWIFLKKMQKVEFFKKSEKILLTSKMEQNPSSCSIGIWNYHLAPSRLKSKILPCLYASPLWLSKGILNIRAMFFSKNGQLKNKTSFWWRIVDILWLCLAFKRVIFVSAWD